MDKFHYVYILQSEKDHKFYVGCASDIKRRLEKHNSGKVSTTRNRRPLKLIYWEGCLNQQDAAGRERYLKTTWGKRYIKSRLKEYIKGQAPKRFGSPAEGQVNTNRGQGNNGGRKDTTQYGMQ